VLAVQGDVREHEIALREFGLATRLVRRPEHLSGLAGLAMPGGESSTMLKLLAIQELESPLGEFLRSGKPVLATCAGLILCAREVFNPRQRSYGMLDVTVERNGFGRQIHSGTVKLSTLGRAGLPDPMSGVFIRAPRIAKVGPECEVLAERNGEAVLVRQGAILGACFHPELESRHPVTELFVRSVQLSSGWQSASDPHDRPRFERSAHA
jgi:5'-phosphate synthase pdxT subunit